MNQQTFGVPLAGDSDTVRGKEPYFIILKALEDPNLRYRTVSDIARETLLPQDVVVQVLTSHSDAIRKSVVGSRRGEDLYALKNKMSTVGDFWHAFRRLNNDKY